MLFEQVSLSHRSLQILSRQSTLQCVSFAKRNYILTSETKELNVGCRHLFPFAFAFYCACSWFDFHRMCCWYSTKACFSAIVFAVNRNASFFFWLTYQYVTFVQRVHKIPQIVLWCWLFADVLHARFWYVRNLNISLIHRILNSFLWVGTILGWSFSSLWNLQTLVQKPARGN